MSPVRSARDNDDNAHAPKMPVPREGADSSGAEPCPLEQAQSAPAPLPTQPAPDRVPPAATPAASRPHSADGTKTSFRLRHRRWGAPHRIAPLLLQLPGHTP